MSLEGDFDSVDTSTYIQQTLQQSRDRRWMYLAAAIAAVCAVCTGMRLQYTATHSRPAGVAAAADPDRHAPLNALPRFVEVTPPPSTLQLRLERPGPVRIDGKIVRVGKRRNVLLAPGDHIVEAKQHGRTLTEAINAPAGEALRLEFGRNGVRAFREIAEAP